MFDDEYFPPAPAERYPNPQRASLPHLPRVDIREEPMHPRLRQDVQDDSATYIRPQMTFEAEPTSHPRQTSEREDPRAYARQEVTDRDRVPRVRPEEESVESHQAKDDRIRARMGIRDDTARVTKPGLTYRQSAVTRRQPRLTLKRRFSNASENSVASNEPTVGTSSVGRPMASRPGRARAATQPTEPSSTRSRSVPPLELYEQDDISHIPRPDMATRVPEMTTRVPASAPRPPDPRSIFGSRKTHLSGPVFLPQGVQLLGLRQREHARVTPGR